MKIKENMTLEQMEREYLSDSAEREFDRIVAGKETKRTNRRIIQWSAALVAAASVLLMFMLVPPKETKASDITAAEIVQAINLLAVIDADRIASVTAEHSSEGIVVTTLFNDGETSRYIMQRDVDTQDVTLVSQNTNN